MVVLALVSVTAIVGAVESTVKLSKVSCLLVVPSLTVKTQVYAPSLKAPPPLAVNVMSVVALAAIVETVVSQPPVKEILPATEVSTAVLE